MQESAVDRRLVRESAIAGSWYPGGGPELAATIQGYLEAASVASPPGDLIGLIAPHAGYMYSGEVAAHAYKLIVGRRFDLVAVVSPAHRYLGGDLAVTSRSYYRTPLGLVPLAGDDVTRLSRLAPLHRVDREEEHSLEIQLPFLQHTLGSFALIPVMMQDQSYALANRLGLALADLLRGRSALLVASTDLSHFHPYASAVALDRRALDAISRFDPEGLDREIAAGRTEACGYGAVVAVLCAARSLGADHVTVLRAANSGDVTGDRSRVVGYAAAAVTRTAAPAAGS
jgi:hypothetical protein